MADTLKKVEAFNGLNIQQIMEILPHRYPFLLVDRVTELVPMDYIKAYKNVSYNEGFFQGHFPEQPVMPGVLMIEALAQTGIILVASSMPNKENLQNKLYVFSGIDAVRFRRQVVPGDTLELTCSHPRNKMALWKMDAKAYVNGQLAVEGVLTAAVVDKEAQ